MTSHPITQGRPGLKAIILAAGKDAITPDGRPLILQPLGDRSILQYVIQNALQLVSLEQISMWLSATGRKIVRAHLGEGYHYVIQHEPLGTAHAVLQVAPQLGRLRRQSADPLRRHAALPPGSIRGLLNRHLLKQAHLTLLTAVLDQPPALRPHHPQ